MKIKVNKKYIIMAVIILLIIIALLVLNTTGVLKKIGKSAEQIAEAEARAKLEQALQNASSQKESDTNYNSSEYLTSLLQEQKILVSENIISIDGYNFEIDRENLEITQSLGKSQVTVSSEVIEVLGKSDSGRYRGKVQITVTSNIPIDNMIFQNENGTFSKEKTTELTYTKEMEIELDKEYVVTVATKDGKVNSKTYMHKYIPPTVSDPSTGTAIRTGNALPFTWEELGEIAQIISNNSDTITSDTAELTITKDGTGYTIGVGDYTTIDGKKVRILGFNHDILSEYSEAEDGTKTYSSIYGGQNKYAGISFEYVDFITTAAMNNLSTNSGGWKESAMYTTLNTTQYNNLPTEVKSIIKQVKKAYCATYNSATLSYSNDYLWLLSCAEIWATGSQSTGKGHSKGIEGSQYKYYKNIDATYNFDNNYLKKPFSVAGTASNGTNWWLRSPFYNYSNYFCIGYSNGGCSSYLANASYGAAPGFSI